MTVDLHLTGGTVPCGNHWHAVVLIGCLYWLDPTEHATSAEAAVACTGMADAIGDRHRANGGTVIDPRSN